VGGACCTVEPGDGEAERDEEPVEGGEEVSGTGERVGVAPCTEAGGGMVPTAAEDDGDEGASTAP
jgi:hypothetical protein